MKAGYLLEKKIALKHLLIFNLAIKIKSYEIKKNYGLQNYSNFFLIKSMCSKSAKPIISAHPLEIETGRYSKQCIPPPQKKRNLVFLNFL